MQKKSKKPSAYAGSWYPGSAKACEKEIRGFLASDSRGHLAQDGGRLAGHVVGGVVPHAGWVYSGSIACRVIASMQPGKDGGLVDTIILFGAHMHPASPAFVLSGGAVETPLGDIRVDRELTEHMAGALNVPDNSVQFLSPESFPDENTLELQYPFIRYFFPEARIIICGVPPAELADRMGKIAVESAAALGRSVRVIGSTDMTHYGPNFGFEPAGTGKRAVAWVKQENDAGAIRAMTRMDVSEIIAQGLANKNMCCPGAAAAAVSACKSLGAAKGVCLDYATSYEQSRSASFVGYCGVVYSKK